MKDIRFPLSDEFWKFVSEHSADDPSRLRLEWHGRQADFDVDFAITQIECRQKFGKKLPSFLACDRFVFPSVLAGEQATNEFVARFHASLLGEECRQIIDCTAGLGIDAITFARTGRRVMAIELDLLKQQCLLANASTLDLKNLRALCADSTVLFSSGGFEPGTTVFIDPHRRDSAGGRAYGLRDCKPDVTLMLPRWEKEKVTVYLKLSPMLDVDMVLKQLDHVATLWAVCYKGECKEVLVKVDLGKEGVNERQEKLTKDRNEGNTDTNLIAVDLNDDGIVNEFECSREFAKVPAPVLGSVSEIEPGHYLYIPSAGIMKIGTYGAVCARFPGLMKLAASTPLFTSMWYYRSFPGRVVRIDAMVSSSDLKKMKGERMTVIARNYPLTAAQLRKKAALKEGDSHYLIGAGIGAHAKPTLLKCTAIEDAP